MTDKIFELINANKEIGNANSMLLVQAMMQLGKLEALAMEYESNKDNIELGKAVEKAFEEGYTLTKNPNKFVSAEIKDVLHLFKWHELINIVE